MSELEQLSRQNMECRTYIETERSKTRYRGVYELIGTHLHTQPRFETIYAILERQECLFRQQEALIEHQKALIEQQASILHKMTAKH